MANALGHVPTLLNKTLLSRQMFCKTTRGVALSFYRLTHVFNLGFIGYPDKLIILEPHKLQ
jgi:hypothetical protein